MPGMTYQQLAVPGAWVFTPVLRPDDRGMFLEAFTAESLREAAGRDLPLAQANTSVSRLGVLRGVHFSDVPPGQAKYVTCQKGAVLDVAVDLRVGSPTFGVADCVLLDDTDRRAVFLSEGLGHGFLALTDEAMVSYFCSTGYAPGREHGVHPFSVAVDWEGEAAQRGYHLPGGCPFQPDRLVLSDKDAAAPTLDDAAARGLLPRY